MMTGTPSLRSCAIKAAESSPRRWKSTSATCGRRSVISFVASAVVAAGPDTLCAQKLKVLFQGVCHTLGILNQKNLQPPKIII